MGPGETKILAEDGHAPLVESLSQGAGVLAGLGGVVLAEHIHLGERNGEGGHRMQVVGGCDPGEDRMLDLLGVLLGETVPEDYTVVRSGEGLMGGCGDDVDTVLEGLLELPSCDKAQDVGAVLPDEASDLVERVLELLEGRREQEYGETELGDLGLHLPEELRGAVHVEVHVVELPRVVDGFDPPLSECPELAGGDVGPLVEGAGGDRAAGLGVGEEHGHVGDGPGYGPHVGEVALEDLLGEVHGPLLHLVYVDVTLVVALAYESLGIPVGEIGDEHLLGQRGHEVLRGDHRYAVVEPAVVLHNLVPDVIGILFGHDSVISSSLYKPRRMGRTCTTLPR